MPVSLPTSPPNPHGDREANQLVANAIHAMTHTMARFRAIVANVRGDDGGEWLQNNLLFVIATSGPVRASTLAETVQTDPSTVSRQVATLVRAGLIERRADPDDGRASLLVLTEAGQARHERHLERRDVHYNAMLADWTTADRHTFAELLTRFTHDFDTYKSAIYAEACAVRSPVEQEHQ